MIIPFEWLIDADFQKLSRNNCRPRDVLYTKNPVFSLGTFTVRRKQDVDGFSSRLFRNNLFTVNQSFTCSSSLFISGSNFS